MHTPLEKIGEAVGAMLLRLMRGETLETHSLDLGYRLVLRESA